LRRQVLATLADPDHYRVEGETGDMVADHLGDRGLVIGVFAEDVLVAYGALGLPGPGEVNRGADLPLPASELARVAHVTSAMVAPACRGLRLHPWLVRRRLEIGAGLGRRHFLTTVSPRNHPSWGNLVACGLHVKRLVVTGGGLTRYLVHRELGVTARFEAAAALPCALWDLDRQRAFLACGRWGWARGRDPAGQPCLMFAPPILTPDPEASGPEASGPEAPRSREPRP
jgi:hypothetical protein